MAAYILRRLLLMIPTTARDAADRDASPIVQFAPGGPVERIIAQLTGSDVGATIARIGGSADRRLQRRQRKGRQNAATGRRLRSTPKYRGAQGLDPDIHCQSLEKEFGFDKPAHERFFLMLKNYLTLQFRRELFPRHPASPT